jgi:hypothetical protein
MADTIEAVLETVIRDLAATVINSVYNRRDHPSYGVTKASIRAGIDRMDGAIGAYMVVTRQANHAGIPALAKFTELATADRVAMARRLANNA